MIEFQRKLTNKGNSQQLLTAQGQTVPTQDFQDRNHSIAPVSHPHRLLLYYFLYLWLLPSLSPFPASIPIQMMPLTIIPLMVVF